MNSVVFDTDVASLIFKGELPDSVAAQLVGYRPCITFVTLAELTKWVELRSWGPQRRGDECEFFGGCLGEHLLVARTGHAIIANVGGAVPIGDQQCADSG